MNKSPQVVNPIFPRAVYLGKRTCLVASTANNPISAVSGDGKAILLGSRVTNSSSTNAVNFSSARTTKRFPSSRCASTIQIVRPSRSRAETQPQLQPALLRLSAMISQYFHVDSILRFSSVQSGHMVSLGKLRADFPELASRTISNASSNEYRPASARRFVYP